MFIKTIPSKYLIQEYYTIINKSLININFIIKTLIFQFLNINKLYSLILKNIYLNNQLNNKLFK